MDAGERELIGRYLAHLSHERRLSPHTDSNYRRDLLALADWCDAQAIARWTVLDSQHVRLFAATSHRDGLAPRSIQRRLSAVRGFCHWLIREGVLAKNPALDVRAPKAQKRLPKALDVDRMARLLTVDAPARRGAKARAARGVQAAGAPPQDDAARTSAASAAAPDVPPDAPDAPDAPAAPAAPDAPDAPDASGVLDARDLAIMELLYSSGLRLAELVGLDVLDLDLRDRTVRVLGKGSKTRVVPVGSHAIEALQAWLRERATIAAVGEQAVFVGRNGRRLGARAVQKRVTEWARKRGLDVKVHPHLFRHSFATHLLESSQDLRGVQELLGHANISTTQVYTHLDFQHLARIYDQSHPRARRRTK